MLELMINKAAYDSLEPDLQRIVKVACATENMLMLSEYQAHNLRSFAELQQMKDITIAPYPEDVQKAFFSMAEEVVAGTASGGDISRRIYESYKTFRDAAIAMGLMSEYGFMRGRRLGGD